MKEVGRRGRGEGGREEGEGGREEREGEVKGEVKEVGRRGRGEGGGRGRVEALGTTER